MAQAKKEPTKKLVAKKTTPKVVKESPKTKNLATKSTVAKSTKKESKLATSHVKEVKKTEQEVVTETTKIIDKLVNTEAKAEIIAQKDEEKLTSEDTKLAKAGKRSSKAIKEAEAKAAKELRKANAEASEEKPKTKPMKVRSRLERRSKKFRKVAENIEINKDYSLKNAFDLVVKTTTTNFDSTVELHVRLGVDPRQADQNIRASLVLPSGTGKKVTVAVYAESDDVALAKKAGADIAETDEFLQRLDKNVLDFDILVATPNMMPKLGKYARVLGPKGLMPSPKSGTVTTDITKTVREAKAGRVEYRVDSSGIIHVAIGKVSFGQEKLITNANAVLQSIKNAKPASIKGIYLKSIYATTTMGPSIKIATSEV